MSARTKNALQLSLLILTAVAVVASGKDPDGGAGDGGGGIQNIPREGWTCGTVGEICTCATSSNATSHCPDWREDWCCIMTPPTTAGGRVDCDCVSPTFLSQISMDCSGYLVQSGEPTDEIVDICPLAPEDMP